jgi:DNA replication protein DnaC
LPSMHGQEPAYQSPLTRRDPRLPQTGHTQTQRVAPPAPPSPQPPQQEAQRYHRHTQPLNPKAVAGMNRNVSQERSQSLPPAQRPSTQHHQQAQPIQPPQETQVTQPAQSIQQAQPAPLPSQGGCPLCKGAGYLRADVPYGHPNFGKPIACECKEAERAEKRRMHLRSISNLDAFRDKSFKNFNPHVPGIQEAFKIAQAYANDPDGWLVLIGRNGCGKTHLAAAIANQHLAKGSLVLFATVPDLLDHLRATFAPSSTVVYDQLFSSMREAELLILDDLGAEQNSPWASEKLFQLLNYRYNSRFPTVITTNKMRLQAVDERIRSRLTDTSLVIEVSMDRAQDYRPHNPQRN